MKQFAVWGAMLLLVCTLIVTFSLQRAPQDTRAARAALDQFYASVQKHDYYSAHQMLSERMQSALSQGAFEQQWKQYEEKHGAIQKWEQIPGPRGSGVSIVPRFVDFTHWLPGGKKSSGHVVARMVVENERWCVDRLNIVR
jgi:hypothetical protein